MEAGRPTSLAKARPWTTDRRGTVYGPPHWASEPEAALSSIVDYNADAALADHQSITLALRGMAVDAVRVGPDGPTEDVDEVATAELARLESRIGIAYGGSYKGLLEAGLRESRTQGGVGIELDVADTLDDVLDIDWVPRRTVSWRVVDDEGTPIADANRAVAHPRLEPVYVPAAYGEPVPFPPEQFRYAQNKRKLGVPHGVSQILPALQTAFDQKELRDDLNRVLRFQGFGRFHLKVRSDAIDKFMPHGLSDDQVKAWRQKILDDLAAGLDDLKADDALLTFDDVESSVLGAQHGTQSIRPLDATQVVDQDHAAALKVMPTMLGRSWGNDLSSTGAVQWVITALTVEGEREGPAALLQWALSQYLRLRGIQAVARVRFEEIRKEDVGEEARAFLARMQAWQVALAEGLVDAEYVAGEEFGRAPAVSGPPPVGKGARAAPGGRSEVQAPPRVPEGARGPGPSSGGPNGSLASSDTLDGAWAEEEQVVECADCGEHVALARAVAFRSEVAGIQMLCRPCASAAERAEPYVPADPDVASPIELLQDADVTDDDAARAVRGWRAWARRVVPAFTGILDAEVIEE